MIKQTVWPFKAICPECGDKMVGGGTRSALVGYISPVGHNHDDNCVSRTYTCKNNHSITVSKINKCPACDWVGKARCSCCPGVKLEEWPSEE